MDCALRFYSNFPCRLSLSELKVDLPCDELVFGAEHPFAMETFQFRRTLTTSAAFSLLFEKQASLPHTTGTTLQSTDEFTLTLLRPEHNISILDLFLLIHCK